MKTKTTCKQRKQLRDFEVANCDLKDEFEDVIGDDSVIDELALSEVEDDE